MSSKSARPEDHPWVTILSTAEDYSFGNLFRVVRATLQYRRLDGRMSEPVTRVDFERGQSVGVLLYDPTQQAVILVRQFRYPVYASLDVSDRAGNGARRAWTLEIVAGVVERDQSVSEAAHKELLEEAGYRVSRELQPIATVYPSPGGTSERVHLFLGEVDQNQRVGKGGGVATEGEDVQVILLPFREAMEMVARGEIQDAKTIIALQHLALRNAGYTDGIRSDASGSR